jgi:hypothetical protein
MKAIMEYIEKTYEALLAETPDVPGVIVEPEVEYYLHESEAINPLVLFFNLVNVLYLVVGTMIMYNIADSRYLHSARQVNPMPPGGPSRPMVFLKSTVEIAIMAAQFVRHVSINFMMMTFYLEITATTLLVGTLLVAALGCGAAAFPVKRMLVNRSLESIGESKA